MISLSRHKMLYFGNTICAAQMSARPKSSNPFYEKLSIYVSPRVSVCQWDRPPVYLHSIFEISSVTRIFFNFKISSLKNWKINLISKLIFAGYTGSRNQVQTRKKIKLVLNSIFFQVWNKLRNPKFENRVQRDRARVWHNIFYTLVIYLFPHCWNDTMSKTLTKLSCLDFAK